MRIDATEFGAITIDAKTYEHDVIIRLIRQSGKTSKTPFEREIRDLPHRLKGGGEVRLRRRVRSVDRRGRPGRKRPIVSRSERVF